ncbi:MULTISPECIES: hypothetical protein [unclassified Streptomyces]|uniref:hypothetical protein n=1 Tax=unclassified Streptomyces TaxID=2593676 RepID=UPI002256E1D4|nr:MULTISPECIES: hypothetical protein [unclassified Streptomyces]MCX5328675.1 hypothetical protein [Streptomyces sp. NBC_00140]MCX5358088.1 hypothetical protein [Streptomyces sp. NBC_00124]
MTGFTDAYAPSSTPGAIQVASDIKEDQSGLLSGVSTFGFIATVLAIAFAVALILELSWRERRRSRPEEPTASAFEPASHEGDISP